MQVTDEYMRQYRDESLCLVEGLIPVEPSNELLLPMEPGDGLLFSNYIWHQSEPNRTRNTRAFYAIAYQVSFLDALYQASERSSAWKTRRGVFKNT